MKLTATQLVLLVATFLISNINLKLIAQSHEGVSLDSLDKNYLNWYNLDPITDKIQGVSVDKAYKEVLAGKKSKKKIVVAVIDSGVDIEHEDLQGKIWVNADEIPGNGIDDDNNGYIDDVHGWNFIGNVKGENIVVENLEYVRIYKNLNPIFKEVKSIDDLSESSKNDYNVYLKCKKKYDDEIKKYTTEKNNLSAFETRIKDAERTIKNEYGRDSISLDDIKNVKITGQYTVNAKNYLLYIYSHGFSKDDLVEMKEENDLFLEKHLNIEYNPRNIISDNVEDINDNKYGNNDVKCVRSDHGTCVSGIIAANRNNNIGINGIAENVEIMAIRTVPKGDERDKDVALSIRYAVDNGANIINMSFGKDFAPQKQFVDEAIKYAEERNVLLVHAAGNDAVNIDIDDRYPSNRLNDTIKAKSWITVGASSKDLGKNFCGVFTNYGQYNVDLFAPGVKLLSLYPENKYLIANGTSFSCPVVSGVAALVWSYYPELTAIELKDILLKSSIKYPKLKVYYPNFTSPKKKKTKFNSLSNTGGLVNAVEALKLAEKIAGEKITKL